MKRNLVLVSIVSFLLFYVFFSTNHVTTTQKITKKTDEDHPEASMPLLAFVQNSTTKKRLRLDESKVDVLSEFQIELIQLQDNQIVQYRDYQFPKGKLIKRKALDDESFVEVIETKHKENVTNIYNGGTLTSEKWEGALGKTIIRTYKNERIFAITEENRDRSTTHFYDYNLNITKRIDVNGAKRTCIKYDSTGKPYIRGLSRCPEDDFQEFGDIRE